MRELLILESGRFKKAMEHASASLQTATCKEIQRVIRLYEADPAQFANDFDRVEQLKPDQVLEVEIGGGNRLLALWEDRELTLLDVGGHETVGRYKRAWLKQARLSRGPADPNFNPKTVWLHRFFGSSPDERFETYKSELNPEWIYALDDQQLGFVAKVKKAYKRSSRENPAYFFAVGGPGTGKTSILTKLLIELRAMGGNPGLSVSDAVAGYIESGGIHLAGSRLLDGAQAGDDRIAAHDAVLIDDPGSGQEIEALLDEALGLARVLVVGFDPCQMEGDMTDAQYEALVSAYGVEVRELRACYRQKETLGKASKRVMDQVARSTPFLREDRIDTFWSAHTLINRLANDMTFPNRYGYEEAYREGTRRQVSRELARIRRSKLWTHTPPVLLVVDEASEAATWPWAKMLGDAAYTLVTFNSELGFDRRAVRAIKGVEFQHVMLALNYRFFDALEHGFAGSGQPMYLTRRSIRIPFTRAKDSLVSVALRPSDEARAMGVEAYWKSVRAARARRSAAQKLKARARLS